LGGGAGGGAGQGVCPGGMCRKTERHGALGRQQQRCRLAVPPARPLTHGGCGQPSCMRAGARPAFGALGPHAYKAAAKNQCIVLNVVSNSRPR
jgi:hypothetical protein